MTFLVISAIAERMPDEDRTCSGPVRVQRMIRSGLQSEVHFSVGALRLKIENRPSFPDPEFVAAFDQRVFAVAAITLAFMIPKF